MAQLTSLNDINRLLHETLGRERAIDGELEGLLAKRGDVEGRLLDLRASTAEARATCSPASLPIVYIALPA